MRLGAEYRVFDRANWRRKARVPSRVRREATEKPAVDVQGRRPLEV